MANSNKTVVKPKVVGKNPTQLPPQGGVNFLETA